MWDEKPVPGIGSKPPVHVVILDQPAGYALPLGSLGAGETVYFYARIVSEKSYTPFGRRCWELVLPTSSV